MIKCFSVLKESHYDISLDHNYSHRNQKSVQWRVAFHLTQELMFESSAQVTWRISNSTFPAGLISAILKKLPCSILNILQSDDTLSPSWEPTKKEQPVQNETL